MKKKKTEYENAEMENAEQEETDKNTGSASL